MYESILEHVNQWIQKHGRNLEKSLFNYHFLDGSKNDVINELMSFQNADGGFGHGLEPDNLNPNSSPMTTHIAINILSDIAFIDINHEIYKGIIKYLNSKNDLLNYGWRFSIKSNDSYPHAPWWDFDEKRNEIEHFGITASLTAFIIRHFDHHSEMYHNTISMCDNLMNQFLMQSNFGDMGLDGLIRLIQTIDTLNINRYDMHLIYSKLKKMIQNAINQDLNCWNLYAIRPSRYIQSKDSPFYHEHICSIEKENAYLISTFDPQHMWQITWTWYDYMKRYPVAYASSMKYWKGIKAIENLLFLKRFK